MNKIFSFVRLDFITVKPYFTMKNLFLFAVAGMIMAATSGDSMAAVAMLMAVGALYVSYPFAVCEKNGIDALYITLSIKRNTVVLGRYLFAFILDIAVGVLAYGFSFIALILLKKEFHALNTFLVALAMFAIYSIAQAIQLPIYFKLGYAKAKFAAYIPFICWPLAVWGGASFLKDKVLPAKITGFIEWFAHRPFEAALLGMAVWLVTIWISYQVSVAYYGKRDF